MTQSMCNERSTHDVHSTNSTKPLPGVRPALPLPGTRVPTFFPMVKGRYLYLIMCLIWRFMVTTNSSTQYMSRMGQNTGTSNTLNSVMPSPTANDLVLDHLQGQGRGHQQHMPGVRDTAWWQPAAALNVTVGLR